MALISMVISILWSRRTLTLDIVTFVMGLLAVVPVLGYIARVVGIITAAIAAKGLF